MQPQSEGRGRPYGKGSIEVYNRPLQPFNSVRCADIAILLTVAVTCAIPLFSKLDLACYA